MSAVAELEAAVASNFPKASSALAHLYARWRQNYLTDPQYISGLQEIIRENLTPEHIPLNRWVDRFCRLVWNEALIGCAKQAHGMRDTFFGLMRTRIGVLAYMLHKAAEVEQLTGQRLPEVDLVQAELSPLEEKLAHLEARWHTVEDLEEWAAEKLAPSPERLAALAEKYPPPQEWYEEEGKPF